MKLNDFNKNLKQEYEENLNLKPKKIKNKKSVLQISLIPAFAIAGLLIAIVSGLLLEQVYVKNYNNSIKQAYNFDYESKDQMYKVNNYNELKELYNKNKPKKSWMDELFSFFESTKTSSGDLVDGAPDLADFEGGTATSDAPSEEARTQFDTNVQEAGVDEADIAKCDGTYIYYLYYSNYEPYFKIYDLSGNVIINQKITFHNDNANQEFDYALYYYGYPYYSNCKLYIRGNNIIIESGTAVTIYKLENNQLTLEYVSSFNRLATSRLIDNYYYFIGCVSYSTSVANYDDLYYDGFSNYNYIYRLYRFNLDTNDVESVDLVDSYYSTYYMNKDYIVIATDIYYDGDYITALKLFDTDLNPLGVYRVKGELNDNFAINIKDKYLRVVSTNVCRKKEMVNNLAIFDLKEEKRIALIDKGLGEDLESVKSVTYNGDKCFVVTFFTTDPLYEIDLSDPYNPVIVDSYAAPGYSAYLKTFVVNNETYVLGLGYIDFDNKISLYKDEDKNVQIGEDYIIYNCDYGMFNDYHSYLFYVSDADNAIYFGVQRTYEFYTMYKINVSTGEITQFKNYTTNGDTRCFLINSVFYIPTRTELITSTFTTI